MADWSKAYAAADAIDAEHKADKARIAELEAALSNAFDMMVQARNTKDAEILQDAIDAVALVLSKDN